MFPSTAQSRFQVSFLHLVVVLTLVKLVSGCSGRPPSKTPTAAKVVDISMRQSLLDFSSGVLRVTNKSSSTLTWIAVHFRNTETNQSGAYTIDSLAPGATREIGLLEAGWKFDPNESIRVSLAGYSDISFSTFRASSGAVGIRNSWW